MKILLVVFSMLFLSTVAHAEEKDWQWYTKCVDIDKNDKVVLETRTVNEYSLKYITERLQLYTPFGIYSYHFTMGSNIWCTMIHRKVYENSR